MIRKSPILQAYCQCSGSKGTEVETILISVSDRLTHQSYSTSNPRFWCATALGERTVGWRDPFIFLRGFRTG